MIHLSRFGHSLGAPAPVVELPEVVAAGSGPLLVEEGLSRCRVSDRPPWQLAAEAVAATFAGAEPAADAVVYATGSAPDDPAEPPELTPLRLLAAVGLPRTPLYGVGLAGCANLATALQLARGLVATGTARTVLLVTADRCPPGWRLMGANLSVLSDGAASCLVTAEPAGAGFRLLDLRGAVDAGMLALDLATETLPALKATVGGIGRAGAALFGAGALDRADVTRLVLNNYGAAGTRILASALGVPADRIRCPTAADVGHCFAADILLNLAELGPELAAGQRLAALMTGSSSWACAALEATG